MGKETKKEERRKEMERITRVAAAFKALSNETRLAVFENIRMGRCEAALDEEKRPSVCHIASNFDMALSTISHHLKELRNAGLIHCEKRGQTIL